MPASRIVFWNLPYHNLIYPIAILSIFIFFYGFFRRLKYWKLGTEEKISGNYGQRLKSFMIYAIGQGRILKEVYPGFMHAFIFFGFLILFLGTVIVSFDYDVWHLILGQYSFLVGNFYKIFSLILDLAGAVAIIGILLAIYRRYIQRPSRLNNVLDNAVILGWILAILITGFLIEAARIATLNPSWKIWSPIGTAIAVLFSANSIRLYQVFWWVHMIISLGFIAYIPF